MTLTLEMAPEIERALEEKARLSGVPVTDYAVRVLAENVAGNKATSGAGVARRQSALDSIPAYDTRVGLPEIEDTSRTAEPDIYGYSEREMEQR